MNKPQIMIDLETMSTLPNACICSIGAVKFTIEDGIQDEFYITIDAKDCKRLGLVLSQDTVDWWSRQNPDALKELTRKTIPLKMALTNFSKWFGPGSKQVWGNGSDFDNVILTSAYRAVELNTPWRFTDNRCYRTMKSLIDISAGPRQGVYHNALDDAKYQTEHLLSMLRS